MIEKLIDVLGNPPLGYGFLEYIFGFVFLAFGVIVVLKFFEALIDFFR